jgi:WD40 repeat protein
MPRTNWPFAAALLAALCGPAGCLYVPPLGKQFTEERQARIVVGETTRAAVVEMLGEPDILDTPQLSVYSLNRSAGTLILVLAGGYQAAIVALPLNQKLFSVLLHFDDRDIVDRYEIEAGARRLDASVLPTGESVSPGAAGRELLFTGTSRDVLGFRTGVAFNALAFGAHGRLLGAGGYKNVGGQLSPKQVWIKDLATGELRMLSVPAYRQVAFSPDLGQVAALKRRVTVVETATGRTITVFKGHGDEFFWRARGASALAFAPGGDAIATGGLQGDVQVWDPVSGAERLAFQAHDGAVRALAWSPNGHWLATSGERTVRLWDARSAVQLAKLPGSAQRLAKSLVFSPDSGTLAINQGTHVELWRIGPGPGTPPEGVAVVLDDVFLLPYFESDWPPAPDLAFSPGGDWLAASNGGLVLYDIAARRMAARVTPSDFQQAWNENDAVLAIACSPDGTGLVTGSLEGVHWWPVAGLLGKQGRQVEAD